MNPKLVILRTRLKELELRLEKVAEQQQGERHSKEDLKLLQDIEQSAYKLLVLSSLSRHLQLFL